MKQSSAVPAPTTPPLSSADGAELFEVYKDHSNVLRGWLTAYGVGAPVLVLSQEMLWKVLRDAHSLRSVALMFLGGLALQASLAAINKYVMWSCYYGHINPSYGSSWMFSASSWMARQAWIDLLIDIAAIALFATGTYLCFVSLVAMT